MSDIPLLKTITTVGLVATTVPDRVPSTPMGYWWHWMSYVDVYNWKDASGYFGTWLAIWGLVFLLWRSLVKPLMVRFGWIKRAERRRIVEMTESEHQRFEEMR